MLLRAGTTSAADVVTDAEAASALHGMRDCTASPIGKVMGWSNADWRERGPRSVDAALDAMPAAPGIGLSPRPYSLEAELCSTCPTSAQARPALRHPPRRVPLGGRMVRRAHERTRDLWRTEN